MSDVQDFHGATFGDEVDEDPNLPGGSKNQLLVL